MSFFSRLCNVFRSSKVSDEVEHEIAFHLDERTDELVAAGMSRSQARREARRRFGNVTLQTEQTRDRDILVGLETIFADVRYALRLFRASPGFTIVAVLSLALGIGANTAIFTVVNDVMIASLPVEDPERLVLLTRQSTPTSKGSPSFTAALWEEIRKRESVFDGLFAYGSTSLDLSAGGEARKVGAGFVSGEFFAVLGVRAAEGRLLGPADDHVGCPAVAVISHPFWRSEYGAATTAVGASVPLDGHPFQIVGVAEPAFFGVEVGYRPAVWVPLCAEAIVRGAAGGAYRGGMGRLIIARLRQTETIAHAGSRVAAFGQALIEAGAMPKTATLGVEPFAKGIPDMRRGAGDSLLGLLAIVAVVLLIACANVANLLLARATARQREIAVRLALGAGTWRVVRQLLTESVVLSLSGAAVGVMFAAWGSRALVRLLSPPGRPIVLDLSLDATVLAFTTIVAVATGLVFGLVPAWRGRRVDPHTALRAGGRGALEGHSRFHAGKAFVVAQIALSLAAISVATLLLGSWRRLAAVDAGFRVDHVALASTDVRMTGLTEAQRATLYTRALERLRAIPGATSASGSSRTPVGLNSWTSAIAIDGTVPAPDGSPIVEINEVTDGYFATMGIPIRAGREFSPSDGTGSPGVAIVSEELARRFLGAQHALGRRLRWQLGDGFSAPLEIVGIAGDAKMRTLRDGRQPTLYLALRQNPKPGPAMTFAVRAAIAPAALMPAVKSAFAQEHPRISLKLTTLEQQVAGSIHLERAMGLLAGFFGAMALALAALGLYGLVSYTVARRRSEIGVRIALGAARSQIVRMVFGDVGRLVGAGIAIGVPLAVAVSRIVASLLYGVTPGDPVMLGLSALALTAVAIGAALLPARRAACLDPMAALRED